MREFKRSYPWQFELDYPRNPFEDFRESGADCVKRIVVGTDRENLIYVGAEWILWNNYGYTAIEDESGPLDDYCSDWMLPLGQYDRYDIRYDIWKNFPLLRVFFPWMAKEEKLDEGNEFLAEVIKDFQDEMHVHTTGKWDEEELYGLYARMDY